MVSTRKRSTGCMQRMSVGLFKKPIKQLNAKEGVKVTGCEIINFPSAYVAVEVDQRVLAAAAA